MVFCDIDGTLINSSHQISEGTIYKIQELYHFGVPFILISARMPSGVFSIQKVLGIRGPIVCYSGALILDALGNPVKTVGIEREKAIAVEAFIKRKWRHISCSFFHYNQWVTDNINEKCIMQEQSITGSAPLEGSVSDFIPLNECIHKLLCMGETNEISDINLSLKKKFPELSICRSKDTYLEIMDGSVSKSEAVKYLCSLNDIPIEATVSFGDNFNDIDMLLVTGTSFAMGNASDEVKRFAKMTTLDSDHEGVLAGLNRLNFVRNKNKL